MLWLIKGRTEGIILIRTWGLLQIVRAKEEEGKLIKAKKKIANLCRQSLQ